MKKMKQPYKSASDGLEALQTYSATPGYFRCILMGMFIRLVYVTVTLDLT